MEVIDSTDTISAQVPIGKSTFNLEFNEFNTRMYVSTSSLTANNVVEVISSTSNTVIDTVTVEKNPDRLRFNPENNYIYTANRGNESVSVIGPIPETIFLNATDGNGNSVVNFTSTTSDSIEINVEIRNQFDVDGVICYLNQNLYDGCEQFDDPISEDPEEDLKACTIEEGDVEVCRFTILIDDLQSGFNNFSIAAFEEEFEEESPEFSTINNKISSNKLEKQIKSSNTENEHFFQLDSNRLAAEYTLPFPGSNTYDNIDQLSINESERLVIQHDPETDDIIVDPTPITLLWEVLQEEPLDTNITSAIDGNAEPVANGSSSTTSTSITFTFTAENNTTDAGFTCVRDDIFIDPCNEGFITYEGLEIGVEHTFRVNAYIPDGEGGQSEVDTTPATWVWTIIPIVDTTLDPPIDGNGDPVANEGSTTSNDINFTFSGQTNANPEDVDRYGFECYLDGGPSPDCDNRSNDFLG